MGGWWGAGGPPGRWELVGVTEGIFVSPRPGADHLRLGVSTFLGPLCTEHPNRTRIQSIKVWGRELLLFVSKGSLRKARRSYKRD